MTDAKGAGLSEDSATDFQGVTELAGEAVSEEQILRMHHRYMWAATYCRDRDAVEAACGSGSGLGLVGRVARTLEAGDYSAPILERARRHYRDRFPLRQFDAQAMPFPDASKDAVILFEAIYYLPDASRFLAECRRVLRPGGLVLIATANKDLSDFNPSPHSHTYYGVPELTALFRTEGFGAECFGYLPIDTLSLRQQVLRPVKRLAVNLGLMPRTMAGKRLLKRLVFGRQRPMPNEIEEALNVYTPPVSLAGDLPDHRHKVVYCVATLPS